jgi:hypothetical protein
MSSPFRRPAAFERADEHVGVHDVAEDIVTPATARVLKECPSQVGPIDAMGRAARKWQLRRCI